jgi:DNA-binding NtrC family response regulator
MPRILIIQNYIEYRNNLVEYFELLGYSVFSDSNCKSALVKIQGDEFDVIICDLDYEYNTDLMNLINFLSIEITEKSHVIFISLRFKFISEITSLNTKHQSLFIINGMMMNEIAGLIDSLLPSKPTN